MLVHAYEYDASGQLTVEQVEDDSSTTVTTYVYDPVGNRLTLEVDGAVTTSTYNVANQLLTAEDTAGVTTYTYDANGNQTTIEAPSGDVTTQTWTCENQLAGVERPDGSEVAYAYAPVTQRADVLRISKAVDGNQLEGACCLTAVSVTPARRWHATSKVPPPPYWRQSRGTAKIQRVRAPGGNDPVNHPNGPHGPHFHPGTRAPGTKGRNRPLNHDHY